MEFVISILWKVAVRATGCASLFNPSQLASSLISCTYWLVQIYPDMLPDNTEPANEDGINISQTPQAVAANSVAWTSIKLKMQFVPWTCGWILKTIGFNATQMNHVHYCLHSLKQTLKQLKVIMNNIHILGLCAYTNIYIIIIISWWICRPSYKNPLPMFWECSLQVYVKGTLIKVNKNFLQFTNVRRTFPKPKQATKN